jgi:hypothetical protein
VAFTSRVTASVMIESICSSWDWVSIPAATAASSLVRAAATSASITFCGSTL